MSINIQAIFNVSFYKNEKRGNKKVKKIKMRQPFLPKEAAQF
jgi:hypothetical protein